MSAHDATATDHRANATTEQILDDDSHIFHSWSVQGPRKVPAFVTGSGTRLTDADGAEWLDFSSQLVFTNIGHQHPRVVAAIQDQAGRLCTLAPNHANDVRGEAAKLITEQTPAGLDHVFFTTGGTEAVEHATRMARQHTGRTKLLAAYRSYHGATTTSIHLTGDVRRWAVDTGAAGVVHFFGPHLYRSAFRSTSPEEECERALAHLEQVITLEGPNTIAAIVLESVVGAAGIIAPPPGYLAGVRDLCDRHGIVWIADEVMCGFGRTGAWFGFEHETAAVGPDLITFAKGVNSGYIPLGGVIVSDEVYETFTAKPYGGGLTYSGHPLACAASVATITAMRDEKIVENAARIGSDVLGPGLRALAERHPSVGDVRGLGVFWAVELVRDRATREPLIPLGASGTDAKPMGEVGAAANERRLLVLPTGNRLHVTPPCTVSDEDVREALGLLDEVLDVADRHVTG